MRLNTQNYAWFGSPDPLCPPDFRILATPLAATSFQKQVNDIVKHGTSALGLLYNYVYFLS